MKPTFQTVTSWLLTHPTDYADAHAARLLQAAEAAEAEKRERLAEAAQRQQNRLYDLAKKEKSLANQAVRENGGPAAVRARALRLGELAAKAHGFTLGQLCEPCRDAERTQARVAVVALALRLGLDNAEAAGLVNRHRSFARYCQDRAPALPGVPELLARLLNQNQNQNQPAA